MNWRNKKFIGLTIDAALILFCLALIMVAAFCSGCSTTVTPDALVDKGASYDGNERNSGFLQFNADGSGLITSRARARYNVLVEQYSGRFSPALKRDAGVTPHVLPDGSTDGNFVIDAEHLVKFATMNRWRKTGVAP